MSKTYSNIIPKEVLREVQIKTLEELSRAVQTSFGPMGSNTIIDGGKSVFSEYTKDGHTIIKRIRYSRSIEQSIKMDCESQTNNVAKEYGDGTTAVIILSNLIFKAIADLERSGKYIPADIVDAFQQIVNTLIYIIHEHGSECTLEDIKKIALISTNNDVDLSNIIADIYGKFGLDVFIDLNTSTDNNTYIKEYDGMTLNSGYADPSFVNNIATTTASIRNPKVYIFTDPVDTIEMVTFFDTIIRDNIITPYNRASNEHKEPNPVPTVIVTPRFSRDMSAYLDTVINTMKSCKPTANSKPPFVFITNVIQKSQLEDIAMMCGAKPITKFIDPKLQEEYIKKGIAPTVQTIHKFAGEADLVEAGVNKTKFVNPKNMYDADGNPTEKFTELLTTLEGELTRAKEDSAGADVVGGYIRRINSLKANMVELIIGGVSPIDRDARKALAEDAILACRSAAANGVGYGANFEGYRAAYDLLTQYNNNTIPDEKGKDKFNLRKMVTSIIYNAYEQIGVILYNTIFDKEMARKIRTDSLSVDENGVEYGPMNIRTKEFDRSVLASIEADPIILSTMSKIVTLMATSQQYLLLDPAFVDAYGVEFTNVNKSREVVDASDSVN